MGSIVVYVGGLYGDGPDVISRSLRVALLETAAMVVVPSPDPDDKPECAVVWSCYFVDGEPSLLRWEATVPLSDGAPARLYVQRMSLEEVDEV